MLWTYALYTPESKIATQIFEPMPETPPIRRSPIRPCDCNFAKSFELIGDRWTMLVPRSALYGVHRFDDFQRDLDIPAACSPTGSPVWLRRASWSGASIARRASARASNIR